MKKLDLAGQRFGMLYVLERASDIESANGSRKAAWLCKCDCGNTKIVRQEYLRQRRDKCSCGCQTAALKSAKLSKPRTVNNPVGERYGRLVIVEESLHIISQTLNKYIKSGKVDTHGWMWKEKYPEE